MERIDSPQKPRVIKVCILGGTGVGKSSILRRFVKNEFDEAEQTTLGAAFLDKIVVFREKTYRFQIWDTAGQEKYAPLANIYYRDCDVALLVYDITSSDSFTVLRDWHKEITSKGLKGILIGCVGNKIDLIGQEQVSAETAKTFADSIGGFLKLTSAKENKGIDDVFTKISEHVYMEDKIKENQDGKVSLMDPVPDRPGGVCSFC